MRVRFPPGASKRIERILAERTRLERRHTRESAIAVALLVAAIRDAIGRAGASPWTIREHARVMRELRAHARAFGTTLTGRARTAARDAAAISADQQGRFLGVFASAALGKRVPAIPVDIAAAMATALPVVDARTEDVGVRTGEDVGQAAVSASFMETRRATPLPAALVALSVGALVLARGRDRAERLIVTEMTAGAAEGGGAAITQLAARHPPMMRVLDATLDRRVCSTCAGLHHVMVKPNEPFPGGYDDAPIHARCRCAVMAWSEDYSALLADLSIAPGPRTGVQSIAELRLPSFTARAPADFIASRR